MSASPKKPSEQTGGEDKGSKNDETHNRRTQAEKPGSNKSERAK